MIYIRSINRVNKTSG